jgi:hypothetical protein
VLTFSKLSSRQGTRTKVSMLKGSAWVDVKSVANKNDEFTLETPTAVMGVRGTHFLARTENQAVSYLSVAAGVVHTETKEAEPETQEVYPTQTALVYKHQDDVELHTAPMEPRVLFAGEDPAIAQAMLENAADIWQENRDKAESYERQGLPSSLGGSQEDLERFRRNLEYLPGFIAGAALSEKLIDERQAQEAAETFKERTGSQMDPIVSQLDLTDSQTKEQQWLREKADIARQEEDKRRQAEEAERQRNAGLLDELNKQREDREQANREALRKAKEQAEQAYVEQLSQTERERFQDDKLKLQDSETSSSSASSPASSGSPSRSHEARLQGLSLRDGVLGDAIPLSGFDAETTDYDIAVPYEVASIRIVPTAMHAKASILVNGVRTASGVASGAIALTALETTEIVIQVTAEDGTTRRTYKVKVTREPSTSAALADITVNGVSIPSFSPSVTSYRVDVIHDTTTAVVAAEPVDGATVVSGTGTKTLEPGDNLFTIVVQAMNGATTSYQLNVYRGSNEAALSDLELKDPNGADIAYSPTFDSDITEYTTTVPYEIGKVYVRPQASEAHAVITVNGTTVAGGSLSGPILLTAGTETVVDTKVVSEDGTATRTYRIRITREAPETIAELSGLTFTDDKLNEIPLAQTFDPATTEYTVADSVYAVNYTVSSVKLTPVASGSHATIKVNGTQVTSGGTISVPINPGTNTISIVVTAQDGVTTQTYTLTVKRKPALATFKINDPVVSGWTGFNPDVYEYHIILATSPAQLSSSWGPAAGCTNTWLSDGGMLTSPTTVLTITAISLDGTLKQTYTFYITKGGSS